MMSANGSISVVTGIRCHMSQVVSSKNLTFVLGDSPEDVQNILIDLSVSQLDGNNTGFYINTRGSRDNFLSEVCQTALFRSGETVDVDNYFDGCMFGVTKQKGTMYTSDFDILKDDIDLLISNMIKTTEQPSFIILDSISESFISLESSEDLYVLVDYLVGVFPNSSIVIGVYDFPAFDFKISDSDVLLNMNWAVYPFLDNFNDALVICYTLSKSEQLPSESKIWNSVAFTAYYQSFVEKKTESKTYMVDQHTHFPVFKEMRIIEGMNWTNFRYD